jgi:2-(1,2-epoxy-1,2-dihydrophenyl)acetyl-CoA isomerase
VIGPETAGDPIRIEVAEGVATITLDSARTRNAINVEMSSALCARVQEADQRDDIGVILLRGEGPAWCVGGAVDAMLAAGDGVHEFVTDAGRTLNPLIATLHESEKMTIAAVHGAVVGAGLGLMAAHDFVVAAEGTVFTVGARALAASPDAGCTYFLARDVGYRRAMALYLSNERFNAVTAMDLGLVNQVVPDDALHAEAARLAARVAAGPWHAQASTKRLLRQAADGLLDRQLEDEIRTLADNARQPDFAEGVAAFLAKRSPRFRAEVTKEAAG